MLQVSLLLNSEIEKIEIEKYNLPGWIVDGYKINTGVPHLVLHCSEEISDKNIYTTGRMLRFHPDYTPPGTNVNFMAIRSENMIFVRTFERGVDDETLSCGTGITASALVFNMLGNTLDSGIHILTRGGQLTVFSKEGRLFLQGPSVISFEGNIHITK